uniref:PR-5-like protein n=1 Tax=Diaprepes abbreviatus TaxID=13040 RepID=Q5I210_DIAAB|nr:PR-5-like protein [Diaprepes abbreviatus]
MSFSNIFLIVSVLVAVSYGKTVTVINKHSTALVITVDGVDYTVASKGLVALEQTDEWSGSITAVPLDAEILDGPKTKVEFSLNTLGDSYSISLVDGFNLPVKVVPNGSTNCRAPVCAANILALCPIANQVINSTGTVVACQNSPTLFSAVCPLAVVDETSIGVPSCTTATSYLVLFL